MADNTQSIKTLWSAFKKYVCLNVENAKLTATEKLTIFFVSMALTHILSQSLEIHYVYFIMAAFYLVILVLIYALKKVLFLNPISRFLSKTILNPPKEKE